jgi:hypothetical protein
MSLDKKIIEEIRRYHNINNYIFEQDVLGAPGVEPEPDLNAELGAVAPPPGGTVPPASAEPAPPSEPEIIDVEKDDEVEKIDDEGKSEEKKGSVEELDITDLVDSQKTIESKQEEYFNNLFSQLSNLESKLQDMDTVVQKLNSLEEKIEKYREKTPEEKLELRTYDSYPFNQKLTDFFDDKKVEMEKTGKHDYILTSDEVTDINANDVRNSFFPGLDKKI